ncbi:MAG: alpha/beta hydrolase [Flavobacteriales bacterium]|nr:alpha/beta hydrolase [Flavobacteriales bacterium]
MKESIYCIPGLGLNRKVFQKLNIPSANLKFIDFLEPIPEESLSNYAARMAARIPEEEFSLLGMSFGGMLSVEIANIRKVKKVFLVSTVKNKSEMPSIFKYIDKLSTSNKSASKLAVDTSVAFKPYYDNSDEEGNALFQEMLNEASHRFLNWALKEIANWEFEEKLNCPFYHIHGTSDLIFPLKNIDKAESLKGGTHFMIYNNAEEISQRIEKALKNK